MIDTQTALEAQQNILWLADRWADLTARLGGSGGGALGVRVQTSERPPLPIDVHVSDLMAEIDWKVARHYCQILIEEAEDVTAVPTTTEGRLRLVAERYGHFVTDDRLALDFCDDASDYRERVRKVFERPAPPEYLGPCPIGECAGELYARGAASMVRCPECLTETTRDEQRGFVAERMEDRLMTVTEIGRALKVVGMPVPPGTLRRWASGEKPKLEPVEEGLYRLAQAMELAGERRVAS